MTEAVGLDCAERLDRASPDLWPEQVPGVSEFAKNLQGTGAVQGKAGGGFGSRFRTELDADDIRVVNELGHLSADTLMEHIRSLQNNSYQLGIEEAKQLSRGKFLQVSVRVVNELGHLSADTLMEHIRSLQNNSYQLGIEEAKQLSRGKFLQVSVRVVNELGHLSADTLMEHIRSLQNNSYQLGIEEAKQLSRGKFLQVLERPTSKW